MQKINSEYKQKFFITFGNLVKKYRLKMGKTISQICISHHISPKTWSNIEKGHLEKIMLFSLFKVSKTLNINLQDLIVETKDTIKKDN